MLITTEQARNAQIVAEIIASIMLIAVASFVVGIAILYWRYRK